MTEKKRKLPRFKSDNAERKFWSSHSIEEFGDELADLEVQILPARTEQIALRLYKDDLETLKKLAKRRGVGHTTLARSVVERWLATALPLRDRTARKRNGVPLPPKRRARRSVTPTIVNRLRDET
jgi:predicted DNA binding CopG/RHH family protein